MKLLVASVLICSTTVAAFADHTDFVSKPADAPIPAAVKKSTRTPSPYAPYTRNGSRIQRPKPAKPDASNYHASTYPAYSRNNPHSKPASAPVITAAGATSQKRGDVSDK